MGRILDQVGIYGYRLKDESRILAGLLTGDPQLFIGRHGAAKSLLAEEVSTALYWDSHVSKGRPLPFVPYDASKASFEDVLGFPNPDALRTGRMEFVHGPITIWDKSFVFIDEINRADPDMQSKWLEVVRSKRIMGYPTNVKFCWAAMNPKGYEGTQDLDEALVGRFAVFNYVPDVLDLSDALRAKVAARVGRDDSPAIRSWLGEDEGVSLQERLERLPGWVPDYAQVGREIRDLMTKAAHQYMILSQDYGGREDDRIAFWVSCFANTLRTQSSSKSGDAEENTQEPILLDGRRIGMIRRQILAVRAVQVVRANLFLEPLPDMREAAEIAVKGSIPTGVNEEGGTDSTALGIIDKTFRTLEGEFASTRDDRLFRVIYRLTSSNDLVERVQLLLTEPLEEITKNSEWTRICSEPQGLDLGVLSLLASIVEAKRPGTIPRNVLSQLSRNIDDSVLRPQVSSLQGPHMEWADRLMDLIDRWKGEGELPQKLLSVAKVNEFIRETSEEKIDKISETAVRRLEKALGTSCEKLTDLLSGVVA